MKKTNLNLTDAEIELIKLKGQLGLLHSEKDLIMHELVIAALRKRMKKLVISS